MSARRMRWSIVVVLVLLSGAGVWWLRRDTAGSPQRISWGSFGFSASSAGPQVALIDQLWDIEERRLVRTRDYFSSSAAWSPDGQLLAASDREAGGIGIWRVADDVQLRRLPVSAIVRSMAWSPDGSFLALGDADGMLTLYRLADNQRPQTFKASDDYLHSIAISPDSRLVAVPGSDCTADLRRADTGELLRSIPMLPTCPSALSFSPDGTLLASGGYDGQVGLWRVSDGQPLQTLSGHTGQVNSVAFSPDGQLLASGAGMRWSSGDQTPTDTTARLWRVADGEPIATLSGHRGPVTGVVFTADGRSIVSVGGDDTLRWWPLP